VHDGKPVVDFAAESSAAPLFASIAELIAPLAADAGIAAIDSAMRVLEPDDAANALPAAVGAVGID
jgi:hypothetical protein